MGNDFPRPISCGKSCGKLFEFFPTDVIVGKAAGKLKNILSPQFLNFPQFLSIFPRIFHTVFLIVGKAVGNQYFSSSESIEHIKKLAQKN